MRLIVSGGIQGEEKEEREEELILGASTGPLYAGLSLTSVT